MPGEDVHKARSYGYRQQAVARLREEIEALVTQAYWQDEAEEAALGSRRGDALPAELSRRETRLATIEEAMRRVEEQATREADEALSRRAEAEAERQRTGEKRRGRQPKPVDERPEDKAQMSCSDAELHIMRTNNTGGEYCGNAQASVDEACQIILACDVTEETNDKKQAAPMAQATLATLAQAGIARPTDARGAPQAVVAPLDKGYYSEAAAQALEERGCDPSMAAGRVPPHGAPPEAPEAPRTAKERMAAQGRREPGRALYARRKVIVAPVFGQSKAGRGFRRFSLRGLKKIRGAWCMVCLTHHLLNIWRYGCVPMAA